MNVYQNYMLFLLELKDLFDKYMLTMNDTMYFMDKNKHYSVTFFEDSFSIHCHENDTTENYDIPELKTVCFEDEFESEKEFNSFDLSA